MTRENASCCSFFAWAERFTKEGKKSEKNSMRRSSSGHKSLREKKKGKSLCLGRDLLLTGRELGVAER